MSSFKNKIILFLSLDLSLLGILTLIIYFEFPPLTRPVLNILKAIWLVLFLALGLFFKCGLWKYKPRSMKGQFGGLKWVANIFYDKCGHAADVEIHWLCPKHKVVLESKELETSDNCHHALFCSKCSRTYDIKVKNDAVSSEDAQIVIKQDILSEVEN